MAQYVCPSASKTRLMHALGLIPGDQAHEDLYNAIKVRSRDLHADSAIVVDVTSRPSV